MSIVADADLESSYNSSASGKWLGLIVADADLESSYNKRSQPLS